MDKSGIISECELGVDLAPEDLDKIAGIAQSVAFKKGETIIREDDQTCDIYIVHDGWVSVEIQHFPHDPATQRLRLLKSKGVVGEFSFIDHSRRSANVMAQEDVNCLLLPCKELNELIESDYRLGFLIMRNMAKLLCTRVRNANFELHSQLIW